MRNKVLACVFLLAPGPAVIAACCCGGDKSVNQMLFPPESRTVLCAEAIDLDRPGGCFGGLPWRHHQCLDEWGPWEDACQNDACRQRVHDKYVKACMGDCWEPYKDCVDTCDELYPTDGFFERNEAGDLVSPLTDEKQRVLDTGWLCGDQCRLTWAHHTDAQCRRKAAR